jgi:hypothetical protein
MGEHLPFHSYLVKYSRTPKRNRNKGEKERKEKNDLQKKKMRIFLLESIPPLQWSPHGGNHHH